VKIKCTFAAYCITIVAVLTVMAFHSADALPWVGCVGMLAMFVGFAMDIIAHIRSQRA
jgi:hypothetical protein